MSVKIIDVRKPHDRVFDALRFDPIAVRAVVGARNADTRVSAGMSSGSRLTTMNMSDRHPKDQRKKVAMDDGIEDELDERWARGREAELERLEAKVQQLERKLADARRPVQDEKIAGVIAFLRESWRNDGAEGESIWLLCEAYEKLAAAQSEEKKT